MKILNYTLGISLALIALIFIEMCLSSGKFFEFEKYNAFGWFVQLLCVIITICIGIKATHELTKD